MFIQPLITCVDHYLIFCVSVFTGFFAIMNPVANTPIFMGLCEGYSESEQKAVAFKSLSLAFVIIIVFTLFGHFILRTFGISLAAFQITGGILIFMIGYHMLNGKSSPVQKVASGDKPTQKFSREEEEERLSIAISPLATPLLAGPGTIATAMSFVSDSQYSFERTSLAIIIAFAALCGVTYFIFINGQKLVTFLGDEALKVITRMMGLILAVMGVQMLIHGIQDVVG